MSKYNDEVRKALIENEARKKGTGNVYFSSKEDNENYFGTLAGQKLNIVGVTPVENADDPSFNHNVVLFDDGHQLSTSRFFAAAGIKWPVGGNTGKINYLMQALEQGKTLSVIPESVKVSYIQKADGTYRVGENWVPADAKGKVPQGAATSAKYTFKPVTFPKVEIDEED